MPPKKNPETPEQQSARFKRDAQKLINDGELDSAVASGVLDRLVRHAVVDEGKEKD